jgi:hypothetical protein
MAASSSPAFRMPVSTVLVVEDHDEMRGALRAWLLSSLPPLRLRKARNMDEALRLRSRRHSISRWSRWS